MEPETAGGRGPSAAALGRDIEADRLFLEPAERRALEFDEK